MTFRLPTLATLLFAAAAIVSDCNTEVIVSQANHFETIPNLADTLADRAKTLDLDNSDSKYHRIHRKSNSSDCLSSVIAEANAIVGDNSIALLRSDKLFVRVTIAALKRGNQYIPAEPVV